MRPVTGRMSWPMRHTGYSAAALGLSIATARRMTLPLTTCFQNGKTSSNTRPLLSTPMIKQPMTVRRMERRPPDRKAPPITTAAILSNSWPVTAFGWAESSLDATMRPAIADGRLAPRRRLSNDHYRAPARNLIIIDTPNNPRQTPANGSDRSSQHSPPRCETGTRRRVSAEECCPKQCPSPTMSGDEP
jgi:hypothetical protein